MKRTTIPVTPFAQNCSLIWCNQSNKAALIDPGGDIDKLTQAIEKQGVELDKVILTHGHMDHVGAATQVAEHYGVPIIGPHRDDQFWIDNLPNQAKMFGLSEAKTFTPDKTLDDGDAVCVGEITLEVMHTPGHTPGHVCLFHRNTNHLFVGDVLFLGSIGRTDFPKSDHAELIKSIKTKLLTLNDEVTFTPGHGPESTIGYERTNNPFLR